MKHLILISGLFFSGVAMAEEPAAPPVSAPPVMSTEAAEPSLPTEFLDQALKVDDKNKVTVGRSSTPLTHRELFVKLERTDLVQKSDELAARRKWLTVAEATIVIGMMGALSTEVAKGTGAAGATVPTPLDAAKLKNMLINSGNPFGNAVYDSSGYQITNNSISIAHAQTESYIDTLVLVSNSNATASNGVAGLGTTVASRRVLLTANGINYAQVLNKTLMGDLITYQITKRVLDNSMDNTTKVAGKNYTAMEHNWDVAFGFWSVPDSFPTVKTPVKYWGSYSNQVDGGLGCNAEVMNAFLKGRAAISNKDMATKNAQALIIVKAFDKMTAAAVIRELKEADLDIAANDMVQLVNHLSEAKAFAMSMKNNKNAGRVISDAQIDTLLGYFPENLWDATPTDLTNIKTFIVTVYGFTPTQLTKM